MTVSSPLIAPTSPPETGASKKYYGFKAFLESSMAISEDVVV